MIIIYTLRQPRTYRVAMYIVQLLEKHPLAKHWQHILFSLPQRILMLPLLLAMLKLA
ncbi:MAG TPA: hypothetical protein VFS76_19245 [Pyrinomonadaceae bacterium]|nr:hypothetical protein [Pyrinomonadaceae bacterium]